jgi:diaminopimelate decarboxylase
MKKTPFRGESRRFMKQIIPNLIKSFFLNQSVKHQQKSILNDVGLWGLSINANKHIAINNKDVMDLVSEYGSPLLVVNRKQLIKDATSIYRALKRIGNNSKVLYSYETNCIPGILKEIHGIGIGAEVISPYELWLAEQLNVSGEEIIYNGVNKTEESLVRAIDMDILAINIDSLPEIDRIVSVTQRLKRKARVGIRLGFVSKAQFGLEIETGEAMEACRRISKHRDHLELNTIHFCVTSNVKDSRTHQYFAKKSLNFIHALKEQTGMVIRNLDLGGGIGVPTSKNMNGHEYGLYRLLGCLPKPPTPESFEEIEEFIGRITDTIRNISLILNLEMPNIIVEPGRFVTSRAEFLLSSVLAIKEKSNGSKFAITDAGRLSIAFPCDFEYHSVFVVDQRIQRKKQLYQIMGRICTSADWMMKNILLPKLREGDILATMDAGAYFSSYSTNFAFPRPAIILVAEDGDTRLLRNAEKFEHLVALDTVL